MQFSEAFLNLLAGERCDALGAELLDVEGGEHGAVAHCPSQGGLVEITVNTVEVAKEAAGEAVTGAGRVADVLQREAGQSKEAAFGKEGRPVLALLGDDGAGAVRHHGAGRAGEVRLAGQLADLSVVD